MTAVEAVVVDIGSVLKKGNPEKFYGTEIPGVDARKGMFDTIGLHGMTDRVIGADPGGKRSAKWQANIEAAIARCGQTHLFAGPKSLAQRLVAEGLLTGPKTGLEM
ncbi:MAG: hypothetical protein GY947_19695 [Rhodobacteraceae bacterium]|nr:hypothetical protein [Paracoccaceae bacterium]